MQNKFFSVIYAINIVAQAIFNLLTPAALMFFVSWIFTKRVGAPEWIYAIAIPLGIIAGLFSMVRFVITASSNLERLEKQGKNNTKTGHNRNEK